MNAPSSPLFVYTDDKQIGTLTHTRQGEYVFTYDPEWLNDKAAFALSCSIPLREAPYNGAVVRNFFGNLLPEQQMRRIIAQKNGISEDNDYALLALIGGECAGALSIVPNKNDAPSKKNYYYEPLSDERLKELLSELPMSPFLSTEKGVSISLAGAQSKLPLYYDGNQLFLPKFGAPSNCILKPTIPGVEHSVENELYCMKLAQAIGLNCSAVGFKKIEDELVFITWRYDRDNRHGNPVRLHQEDFCQLLGISYQLKYEAEGGPGLKECSEIIRKNSTLPILDLLELFKWSVFNACIGNMDAHGKNISMLYRKDGGCRLAPFYDLLSTMFYGDKFSQRLAMSIGGKTTVSGLNASHWQKLAADFNFHPQSGPDTANDVVEAILKKMTPVADSLIAEGLPKKTINQLLMFVATQTREIKKGLSLK